MTKEELSALPQKVRVAIEAGKAAAEAYPNDGGSANLDRVVIPVPGLRVSQLPKLPGYVQKRSGYHQQGIHLDTPWPGQGNQHSAGVRAMHSSLQAQGVHCYIWHQID